MTGQKMKKYTANFLSAEIYPTEVEKETEKSVWVNGRRRSKFGEYGSIFDTWEAAHEHLLRLCAGKIKNTEKRLDREKRKYDRIKLMTPPEDAK